MTEKRIDGKTHMIYESNEIPMIVIFNDTSINKTGFTRAPHITISQAKRIMKILSECELLFKIKHPWGDYYVKSEEGSDG